MCKECKDKFYTIDDEGHLCGCTCFQADAPVSVRMWADILEKLHAHDKTVEYLKDCINVLRADNQRLRQKYEGAFPKVTDVLMKTN